jgi:hypothetical protein
VTTGATGAGTNPDNFDGALNLSGTGFAEATTPGFHPSAETVKCDRLYKSKGGKSTYQQGTGYGGIVCGFGLYVAGLIDHASQLSRAAIGTGVRSLGTVKYPFPLGIVDYVRSGGPFGREYWRMDKYSKGCSCWLVSNPTWHPAP